jgi:hypothetical protein
MEKCVVIRTYTPCTVTREQAAGCRAEGEGRAGWMCACGGGGREANVAWACGCTALGPSSLAASSKYTPLILSPPNRPAHQQPARLNIFIPYLHFSLHSSPPRTPQRSTARFCVSLDGRVPCTRRQRPVVPPRPRDRTKHLPTSSLSHSRNLHAVGAPNLFTLISSPASE